MFSRIFVFAVLAASAQNAIATNCLRSYIVQEGDYCDKISQAQNVSTYQLAVLNSNAINSACSNLLPGQTICLADNADEDCNTTYLVLSDDNCEGIATKNGLNTTILFANNPQINEECSNIYPGEVLCTSKDVRVAPIPAGGVTVAAPVTTIVVTPTSTPAAVNTPAPVAGTTLAPAGTNTPAPAITNAPAPAPVTTPKATTEEHPTPSATPSSAVSNDGDDDDDDNLPFCDEL